MRLNRSCADYTKKGAIDSIYLFDIAAIRAVSHFHRLRNGSSREVRKDCRERERCARITPWPSGDVSPGCPTSGSLPAISFKLTLLMESPPRFRDRLPHFQPSLSPSSLSHENYSLVRFPSDGKSNLLTDLVLHPCTKKRLFKSTFSLGRISNINIRVSIPVNLSA